MSNNIGNDFSLESTKLAVIGLGYVGLPLAVEFGKLRPVIGYDINLNRIKELQAGNDTTLEVETDELESANKLSFTNDLEEISNCNDVKTIKSFALEVYKHKKLFKDLILNLNDMGKKVLGYGASTKGNVILQDF